MFKNKMMIHMKKTIITLLFLGMCCFSFKPQDKVEGKVTNKEGDPLTGVKIIYNDHYYRTDFDGHFSFPRSKNDSTIKVSYVSFKTDTINIKNKDNLKIKLSSK